MKIDIIIVYMQRYKKGHEVDFVPPITGIHLAAITPLSHQVRIIHHYKPIVPYGEQLFHLSTPRNVSSALLAGLD